MTGKYLTLTAIAATCALGATATPGIARDMRGPAPAERGFIYLLKNADTNKDGKITEEEAIAFQGGRFAEIDVNEDGVITPGEFSDYRKAKIAEFRENNPRPERSADKAGIAENSGDGDRDRNGWKPHMAMRDGGHHRMGPGAGHHRNWQGYHRGNIERIFFVRADSDRSGQISEQEFSDTAARMFSRMDRNGDMVITVDDLPDRPMRW
ncbi:UNVERIFIED_ORG: EF hand domain-containing protein [Martelella mediterranea]